MKNSFLLAGALLVAAFASAALRQNSQEKPKESANSDEVPFNPTPEDLAKKNPVAPTAEGLAAARKLFGYHCAMCHGEKGDGKGDLAISMKLQLSDWRDPESLAKRTDGELFYIITHGKGKMVGGEGDRTSEKERWNLVSVVRSFAKKSAAEKPKSEASR